MMQTKAELRAERDHYKQLAEEGLMPRIKDMRLGNGEFNMSIIGPITEYIATAFIGQFKAGGAVNFMEMNLFDREEPFHRYTLTVQKVGAKTPTDKLRDAEARIEELESALRPFAEYMEEYGDKDNLGKLVPNEQGVGWIYLNHGHFRSAREALAKAGTP